MGKNEQRRRKMKQQETKSYLNDRVGKKAGERDISTEEYNEWICIKNGMYRGKNVHATLLISGILHFEYNIYIYTDIFYRSTAQKDSIHTGKKI